MAEGVDQLAHGRPLLVIDPIVFAEVPVGLDRVEDLEAAPPPGARYPGSTRAASTVR